MAAHSSILAWRIPWTEEPDGLQSAGWQSLTWLSTHRRWGTAWLQLTRDAERQAPSRLPASFKPYRRVCLQRKTLPPGFPEAAALADVELSLWHFPPSSEKHTQGFSKNQKHCSVQSGPACWFSSLNCRCLHTWILFYTW